MSTVGPERAAFDEAAAWFVTVVRSAGDRWEEPGLGEWSVRDLVGHTSRALSTIAAYLTDDVADPEVASAEDYFRVALASPADQIAERGRRAGVELGADPGAAVGRLAEEVGSLVHRSADESTVRTPFGSMRLGDNLPTRTFELTVHTCDLAAATGQPVTPPPAAASSALRLLAGLASTRPDAGEVLLALTGRRPLPRGYSALG